MSSRATVVLLREAVQFPTERGSPNCASHLLIFKGAKFHYHTITASPETELPFPVDAFQCHMSVHLKDAPKYLKDLCLPFVYFVGQDFISVFLLIQFTAVQRQLARVFLPPYSLSFRDAPLLRTHRCPDNRSAGSFSSCPSVEPIVKQTYQKLMAVLVFIKMLQSLICRKQNLESSNHSTQKSHKSTHGRIGFFSLPSFVSGGFLFSYINMLDIKIDIWVFCFLIT